MIDLTTLSRVRFQRGRAVHEVTPPGSRTTGCRKHFYMNAQLRDIPLPPEMPVTCRGCLAANRAQEDR